MKNVFIFAVVFLFIVLSIEGNAQIPRTLSYQGVLTDSSGNPKPDNAYSITFRLYDVEVGGNVLWTEVKVLQVKRGLFTTILGDQTPIPDSLQFDRPYWLSLQVASEPELEPRLPFTAVSYSLYSQKADTAKYAFGAPVQLVVDSARIASSVPDNSITGGKISNDQVVRSINSRKDNIILAGQGGATITSGGDTIYINAGSGGDSTGIFGIQNTNNTLDITDPNGPTVTVNVKSGVFLPLAGGTMTGAITNTGNPSITMGKGNFGTGNTNTGLHTFVAGINNQALGNYSVISGGGSDYAPNANSASGDYSTISGGKYNRTLAQYSTISGGQSNRVDSMSSVISGGEFNHASNILTTIGGGSGNNASGQVATVAGGMTNIASGNFSAIGGGHGNDANGDGSVISGGGVNVSAGSHSTISGGNQNQATAGWSTVSGGRLNKARGQFSVVCGGGGSTEADSNSAIGMNSFIGGGKSNFITGPMSVITGGEHNNSSNSYTTISGGSYQSASGQYSTVGGGISNSAGNNFVTIGGGNSNIASGVSSTISGGEGNFGTGGGSIVGGGSFNKARGLYSVVSGGGGAALADSNSAIGDYSTIDGGRGNIASGVGSKVAGINNRARGQYSVVSGGGGATLADSNSAIGNYSTIGGGYGNNASGNSSTIGGGDRNVASYSYSTVSGGFLDSATGGRATVGGGEYNNADGSLSTVSGGTSNTASGTSSTVPGGSLNSAEGDYSFAAGLSAKALHDGSFVWSDATNADFESDTTNQFKIRATNGVNIASAAGSAKEIRKGDYYRDNSIVAWAKITSGGTIDSRFGIESVVRNTTGNYTILVQVSANSAAQLIPMAIAEIDTQPVSASSSRIVSINQLTTNSFRVYIQDGTFAAVDNDFTVIVTGR